MRGSQDCIILLSAVKASSPGLQFSTPCSQDYYPIMSAVVDGHFGPLVLAGVNVSLYNKWASFLCAACAAARDLVKEQLSGDSGDRFTSVIVLTSLQLSRL